MADFGVARAISAAGDDRLTETGFALGTPSLHEPGAGRRQPGAGRTERPVRARLRAVRDARGPAAVRRGHRPAAAGAPRDGSGAAAPDRARHGAGRRGAQRDAGARQGAGRPVPHRGRLRRGAAPHPARRRSSSPSTPAFRGRRRIAALAAAGLALVLALAGYLRWPHPAVALDPNLVAVVPFRVGGAAPELGYLREGMIDLVAARLTGEGGARAADPRRGDDRVAAVRGLRGGRSPRARRARPGPRARRRPAPARGRRRHAAVTWRSTHRCSRSKGGRARAEAKVEGAADSLPQLVDRLIAQLITEGAGASHGLDGLVNTPLPALRLYLEAQAA